MKSSLNIDGLEKGYDAVVLGTNLGPSIVGAAAGFSKHTVLHLDANDFYGHLDDATFTFDQAMEWAEELSTSCLKLPDSLETSVSHDILTRVADGLDAVRATSDQTEDDVASAQAKEKQPTLERIRIVKMNRNPLHCAHVFSFGPTFQSSKSETNVQKEVEAEEVSTESDTSPTRKKVTMEEVKQGGRRFCIDVGSPMAIFANGTSVDLMVASGVGRYLEFLSMDSLNMFEQGSSWRVPCSKRDIFASKELSVMEKNRLMKLLRFVMDWGVVNVIGSEDLSTQGDEELKAGRSLQRPQNKGKSASMVGPAVESSECFLAYLQQWNISDKLRDAIMYAIAFLPDFYTADGRLGYSTSTVDGLAATFRHLSALNQYGNTGLLSPLYGSGEISQAFCRLCAVSRGTYILRHALYGVVVEASESTGSEKVVGVCDEDGNVVTTSRFVCNGDYLTHKVWDASNDVEDVWTVRRACILDGQIADGKALLVIKPNTEGIDNLAPIFVVQSDDSTESCPRGLGVSLVHLTTTAHKGWSATSAAESLRLAVLSLTASVRELWHLSFALPLSSGEEQHALSRVQGVAVLGRLPYSYDPHPIAKQAQRAFEQVFEGSPYFVQTEEEREEAARARGEWDEEATTLEDAINEGERREAQREEKLNTLMSRIDKLESEDRASLKRIEKLERIFKG